MPTQRTAPQVETQPRKKRDSGESSASLMTLCEVKLLQVIFFFIGQYINKNIFHMKCFKNSHLNPNS